MLTSKQKKQLKSIAQLEHALYQIGKNEISSASIEMFNKALEARELIKISILKTCETPIREVAIDLASTLHAEIVTVIGHCIVLYRKSKSKNVIQWEK